MTLKEKRSAAAVKANETRRLRKQTSSAEKSSVPGAVQTVQKTSPKSTNSDLQRELGELALRLAAIALQMQKS